MLSAEYPRASYALAKQDVIKQLKRYSPPTYDPVTYVEHTELYGSKNSDTLYQWLVKNSEAFGAKKSRWQSIYVDDDRVLTNNL